MWELLATPALWLLGLLHGTVESWGVAISVLAVVAGGLRMAIRRASERRTRRQTAAQEALAPELEHIKRTHLNDRERLMQEISALYGRAGVNPLGGCMTSLLGWLLFAILGLSVYAAVRTEPELALAPFLWLPALGERDPLYLLPMITLVQAFLGWMLAGARARNAALRRFAIPTILLTLIVPVACFVLPSGLVLYVAIQRCWSVIIHPVLRGDRQEPTTPGPQT